MFSVINRGELNQTTEHEFENLNSRLKGLWLEEHNEDGTHRSLDASIIATGTIDAARLPAVELPGVIKMYGGSTAPTGYLLCDGSAVSRTTYADLFAIVGTTFGSGDGSTTFNIPDIRQRFPLGKAASGTGVTLGSTGGSIDHTHVYTSVPSHTHSVTDPGHGHSVTDPTHTHGLTQTDALGGTGAVGPGQFGTHVSTPITQAAATGISIVANTTGISIQNTGIASPSTQSANPPFITLNFIIKV